VRSAPTTHLSQHFDEVEVVYRKSSRERAHGGRSLETVLHTSGVVPQILLRHMSHDVAIISTSCCTTSILNGQHVTHLSHVEEIVELQRDGLHGEQLRQIQLELLLALR
jgi:hypothetical protein